MIKAILAVIILCALFSFCGSIHKLSLKNTNSDAHYCSLIDTIFLERYKWKSGNFYANRIIPILSEKSKIYPHCNIGRVGYRYENDSIFDADLKLWKLYFKCQ